MSEMLENFEGEMMFPQIHDDAEAEECIQAIKAAEADVAFWKNYYADALQKMSLPCRPPTRPDFLKRDRSPGCSIKDWTPSSILTFHKISCAPGKVSPMSERKMRGCVFGRRIPDGFCIRRELPESPGPPSRRFMIKMTEVFFCGENGEVMLSSSLCSSRRCPIDSEQRNGGSPM